LSLQFSIVSGDYAVLEVDAFRDGDGTIVDVSTAADIVFCVGVTVFGPLMCKRTKAEGDIALVGGQPSVFRVSLKGGAIVTQDSVLRWEAWTVDGQGSARSICVGTLDVKANVDWQGG
jgi:hypothetical protein